MNETSQPSVKAIEYYGDGVTIKRVDFFAPADYRVPVAYYPIVYTYNPYQYPYPNAIGDTGTIQNFSMTQQTSAR